MRKDIEYSVDNRTVDRILEIANKSNLNIFMIDGVMNDNYLIVNEVGITLGKNVKARAYIIIEEKYLNEWSSDIIVTQTDDEDWADEMYNRWGELQDEIEKSMNN